MTDLDKQIQVYEEAVKVCEAWRLGNGAFTIQKATPNELHLYNIFTSAKKQLLQHQACLEDAQGTYMQRKKND